MDDDNAQLTSGMTEILSSDTPAGGSPSGSPAGGGGKPFLTAGLPGTGGRMKSSADDFLVEEIPLFPFSGEGQHTVFQIEKSGLSTFQAAEAIGRALGIAPDSIGYAGLKDSRARTRQFLSAEGVSPEQVLAAQLPSSLKILSATRHEHKLKAGMLAGNRFEITVRDCASPANAGPILRALEERGVPNYFGEQRFGSGRDVSADVGRRLVSADFEGALSVYVSKEGRGEGPQTSAARRLFSEGKREEALQAFPRACFFERSIIAGFLDGTPADRLLRRVFPRTLVRLFISALQSEVFNAVVAKRIGTIDGFIEGDIGMFPFGAVFFRNAQPGDPRLKTFEVSPSGPLIGFKVPLADGAAGEIERAAMAATAGVPDLSAFRLPHMPGLSFKGARRPLRVRLSEPRIAGQTENSITLSFKLPKGAYATEVMREVMK